MSVSMDMIVELLPLSSKLQRADNPLRIVLDRTVGEWLDNFEQPFEQLFLTSATGGWLDAWGKDYGVPRRLDEDDEHYRQRIIYEKLDHLTPALLNDVYNVKLFTYREDFDVSNNTLVSDNPHIVINDSFLGVSDEDTISILDKKFILDSVVTWINSDGDLEYILDTRGKNILSNYSKIYNLTILNRYFFENEGIEKVKLALPNASNCGNMFSGSSNLDSVNLTLPNATDCRFMFAYCTGLKNVKLNLPKLENYNYMFDFSSISGKTINLETIDITIPTNIVTNFKSYVTGLNLEHLTSFIINGEEQL